MELEGGVAVVTGGAHAEVAGLVPLTRDATRYRTYLPGLEIVAP